MDNFTDAEVGIIVVPFCSVGDTNYFVESAFAKTVVHITLIRMGKKNVFLKTVMESS